jgi:beta-N-acetylhexosaminidase
MNHSSHGRLMLDLAGTSLAEDEPALLCNPQVGGVILFARNVESRHQVETLVAEIRAVAPHLLIAVDQEGGRVQRLKQGFTLLPAMQKLGDLCLVDRDAGVTLTRDCGWLMAAEVIACGLDISFAPVLDVDRDTSSIIGDRAFSDQPQLVTDVAAAFITGMNEAGMAATGKHFPGHGGIFADSHLEAPVDQRDWAQLSERDLVPFVALADKLGGIMPAHITFPTIDPDSVGFSSFWLQQVLRDQLGFDGVIFSDDLAMKGADVAGGYVQKAQLALDAGCDMILVCNDRAGALEVLDFMTERQVSSSDRIKGMLKAPYLQAPLLDGKSLSWAQLENHPRRVATMAQLQNMNS